MRTLFEIWTEGFVTNGERGSAMKYGEWRGSNFQDACNGFAKNHPEFAKYYRKEDMTWWGCRIFDNQLDAIKSFG